VHVSKRIVIQVVIFGVITLVAGAIMLFGYVKLPAMFGVGRYTVTVELPRAAGLYPAANVTYRGTQVGKVESVRLSEGGTVRAVLSMKSGTAIPSNLRAEVHSQTAIGEQYVELLPADSTSTALKDGDTIPLSATSVPPAIDSLLDTTNRGLQAIPHDSLRDTIDESYTAFGGLGPELSRIVKGSTEIAHDARANLDALTTLIDQSGPVLDSQTDTSDSIQAWASHLATVSSELRDNDSAVAGLIDNGGAAADEGRQLVERWQPTLPVILTNLVSVNKVAITYQNDIEQLLVLAPQGIANVSAGAVPSQNTNMPYRGAFLNFNLGLNVPPPCATGYLPPTQRRTPAEVDAPDRPDGSLYCRIPQDSPFYVRGARNIPCETVPGKRAPTVKMCESDEQYVPLNDGYNWKGDPNATWTGQDIPQLPPGAPPQSTVLPPTAPPPAAPPLAIAQYDPATGSYIGPDGKAYTQRDLADTAPKVHTWQDMLTPPA
jgi:phospholipid/cholesterol/gamma-HCH transport system substrate-binding protein